MAVISVKGCVDVDDSLLFQAFTIRGGRDVGFSFTLDTHQGKAQEGREQLVMMIMVISTFT